MISRSATRIRVVQPDGMVSAMELDDVEQTLAAGAVWIDVTTSQSSDDWREIAHVLHSAAALPADDQDVIHLSLNGHRLEGVVPYVDGDDVAALHMFAERGWLVTVHDDRLDLLTALDASAAPHGGAQGMFLVAETAIASFRPSVEAARRAIEDLEDAVLADPTTDELEELVRLRRRLVVRRRAIRAFVDALDALQGQLATRDDIPADEHRLIRAFSEQLAALHRRLQAVQESTGHAIEAYTSVVATQQSQVINRLTALSMVFLPLTFLTGFFGMNFAWLLDHTDGATAFWLLGVALQGVIFIAMVTIGRRAKWLRTLTDLTGAGHHSQRPP